MNLQERDTLIKKLYLENDLSMDEIGKACGVSRNRISQILLKQGVPVKAVRGNRNARLLDKIKLLIEAHPEMTNSEVAEQLKVKVTRVKNILYAAGIKRDRRKILSKVKTERARKGRTPLTKDLLYRLYVTENKTTTEIGAELNCSFTTIAVNLRRFGIKLRKSGKRPALSR